MEAVLTVKLYKLISVAIPVSEIFYIIAEYLERNLWGCADNSHDTDDSQENFEKLEK